ncbi:MAG: hypothetical protein KAQ98_05020 [Bacteriovoracaceae bacterium]|nr:hypothetical protein [Bacteriovoracaceae bacterium]
MDFCGKIIILIFLLSGTVYAKVQPPNYDFSLDTLIKFSPGKNLKEIEKEFGNGELIEDKGDIRTVKFYIAHIRYKFPVFVQVKEGVVLDFFARLPSYFLHNVFHQSLINRFGKQDIYSKREESAVYIWKDVKGLKHIYSGTCTITCFPVFYSQIGNATSSKTVKGYIPIAEKLMITASGKK